MHQAKSLANRGVKMRIEALPDHPEHMQTLGRWAFDSWGHFYPGRSLEETTSIFRASTRGEGLPITLIALDESRAIGMASLVFDDDLPDFRHLTPWLASVYVEPDKRNTGIGSLLVEAILERARNLGWRDLYLWTEDREDYYRKRGWRRLATTEFIGFKVSVMTRSLR